MQNRNDVFGCHATMYKLTARLRHGLGAALLSSVIGLSAMSAGADDTEIFFNQNQANTTAPNILFIFDTSGSMNGLPANSPPGDNRKRIEVIKEAMKSVIDQVSVPVNIGMMRFTASDGGAILYPVTNIDAPAKPEINVSVSASANDATEAPGGAVTVSGSELRLGASAYVGVRFSQVDIPQGAKITGAALQFYPAQRNSNTTDTGSLSLRIRAELSNPYVASLPFEATNNNIKSRNVTTAKMDWSPDWWYRYYDSTLKKYIGAPQTTPVVGETLVPIVQEVVNHKDWCGGQPMSFIIQKVSGSGTRDAQAFEGDSARSVSLVVTYSEASADFATNGTIPRCYTKTTVARPTNVADDARQLVSGTVYTDDEILDFPKATKSTDTSIVGLRFPNLKVPASATIQSAQLSLYSADSSTPSTTLSVQAVDSNNAVVFTGVANSLSTLPTLGSASTATFSGWDAQGKEWIAPEDFSAMVQSIVNKTGWQSGNAAALLLKYSDGNAAKKIFTVDKGLRYAPKLTVRYRGSYEQGAYLVRDRLKAATNGFKALGGTPVADSLAEAAKYYRSESALYGTVRGSPTNRENNVSSPLAFQDGYVHTVPSSCNLELDPYSTACKEETIVGSYKSPITDSCQSNHIVLLTDGEPTIINTPTNTWFTNTVGNGSTCKSNDGGVDCSIKTVSALKNADQSSLPGTQTISTHGVSFSLTEGSAAWKFMNNIAVAGGDEKALNADNEDELIEALLQIINNIVSRSSSFVSAGVTVSQTNRLIHEDSLYFALFKPSQKQRWDGNLKKYRIGDDGVLYDASTPAIEAVNPLNDQFVNEAKSFWSTNPDGNEPRLGGAASQLTNARKVYTNSSGSSSVELSDGNHNLHESNSAITEALLGAVSSTERSALLQWGRGIDVDDLDGDGSKIDAHQLFGDPIHSRPTLVRYKVGTGSELRAFVGTNHGYLHSIDASNGAEKWAFFPKELYGLLKVLRENSDLGPGKTHGPYGLDGTIRLYSKDSNGDGLIDASANEKAYLYFGMRRGGKSYFALDVSKPDAPKLMFVINESSSGFENIGQTWSVPYVGMIKTSSGPKLAMIFGGGYDTAQDIHGAPLADNAINQGNTLYVADAETGSLIWSSTIAMNALAADISALDTNGDEMLDNIYAADMRAQIFRFDAKGDGTFSERHLASLQPAVASVVDNRRFYAKVDPAYVNRSDGTSYVSLAIGSGFRAHPLEKDIQNHFYVLRDTTALDKTSPSLITVNDDLIDVTSMLGFDDDGRSDALVAIEGDENDTSDDKAGWYIELDQSKGEKVLAESVTFDFTVYFSTYLPISTTGCGANAGTSRQYAVSIFDGMPVKDRDGDSTLEEADRYQELQDSPSTGMTPPTVLISGAGPQICWGNKCELIDVSDAIKRVKWRHVLD